MIVLGSITVNKQGIEQRHNWSFDIYRRFEMLMMNKVLINKRECAK